jgi:mannose-6-phosphate isomerase-like protein (cupin superfamily)
MRRVSLVLFVVLFGALAVWVRSTAAQEPFATPGPGEFELVPGQIGRELASGLVPEPPAGPVYFGLLHITVAPGSVFNGTADDASVGLNLVESGELTLRLEAAVTVTRTTGPEEVAAGTEFTLGPGESFIWPPNVAGELRNDGSEPAVQLLAFLAPAEGEAATPMAGTPTQ